METTAQVNTYNKRIEQEKQISFTHLYTLNSLIPFFSITLSEFNKVIGLKLSSINKARVLVICLHHINKYPRTLQTKLIKLYRINYRTLKPVLDEMERNGFIVGIPTKRQTNINGLVPLKSFSVTVSGKNILNALNALFDAKMNKIKK